MNIVDGVYRRKTGTRKNFQENKILNENIQKKALGYNCYFERSKYDFWILKIKNYNVENIIKYLYQPTCSSSLGIVRALFGLMMIIDIPDERGLANIDLRFGDPMRCHFPLFDWLSPLPLEYMGLLYTVMWIGAFGICLGFKFKISCVLFIFPYWYIYLLDKSFWNNHSYLYGLVSVLFSFTDAHYSFSVDALLNPSFKGKPVPLWNYGIIRFQFFLLYFYAGMKKFHPDWIRGYSMTTLSLHWVFEPFRLILNNEQIDLWIIHVFGFLFDLSVGFFLLLDKTRPVAIFFSTAFHVMNSCMFHIGQFPYVCLVTTPIFCNYNWPEQIKQFFGSASELDTKVSLNVQNIQEIDKSFRITYKQKLTCFILAVYVSMQLFLPYSHFLTQGYNNWTNGLYGYSWDMMVQNWGSNVIVIRVIDNYSKEEFFIDPEAWVGNTRYSKHGDMLIQYAKCLKRNLNNPQIQNLKGVRNKFFDNISIYADVWCSLNGRFQQRMFNPNQDLLTAEWDPFSKINWLMPLLSDLSHLRKNLHDLQKAVHSWSNHSEVLFVADFPGLNLENYMNFELNNITVTVLQGIIVLEQIDDNNDLFNVTLTKGDLSPIKEGEFHKIYTVSEEPSSFMYTFNNVTLSKLSNEVNETVDLKLIFHKVILHNFYLRIEKLFNSLIRLRDCFNKLIFNTPVPRRSNQMGNYR